MRSKFPLATDHSALAWKWWRLRPLRARARERGRPRRQVQIGLAAMLIIAGVLLPAGVVGAADAASQPTTAASWPQGWLFKTTVRAPQRAEHYDVLLDHDGLAQPDARDIRIFGPDGQPVSYFIAYCDPLKARIIFDGSAGAGEYAIYFDNLSSTLPEIPQVADFGRKDWLPSGGYTVNSYAEVKPLSRRDILGHVLARKSFEAAEVAAKTKAEEQKDAAHRSQFLRTRLLRGTDGEMGSGFYHDFRAEIDVPAAGEYQIQFGAGAAMELGLLYLDGNPEPIIEGSFKTPDAMMVIATQATLNLSAGVHVFEMLTNRRTPDMRMRPTSGGGPLRWLTGLDSHFDHAEKLTCGMIDSGAAPLADAYLATVREWIAQGRFSHARALAQLARKKFPGNADRDKLLADAYEQAGSSAYESNWLTEGKFSSRTGVTAAAGFYPPLRMSGTTGDAPNWDSRHISSTVSLEGKLIYGLPFPIMLSRPWGVTSAICVDDNVLYVGSKNGVMHAIDVSSGDEKWAFAAGGSCLGPPLLYRGVLYYGGMDRRLYAVDAQRGRMLWNFPVGGWVEGGAAAADGRIYFGSRDGVVYAVDAALGVERWHTPIGAGILGTPCAAGGRVYVGDRAGDFAAMDASSGRVAWKFSGGAEIVGGACATETRVAFGDRAGNVHCLDAATGKPAWNQPAQVGGTIMAAPILVGEILFGGTEMGNLFGIDFSDGVVGWEAPMPGGGCIARPAIFAADTLTFTSRTRVTLTPDGKPIEYRGNTASFVVGAPPSNLKWTPVALDDPTGAALADVWGSADKLPGLLKPNGLSAGDGPADIRLAWDEKHLYVNATIRAADLVSPLDQQNLRSGSAFTLLLDPRRDGAVVYEFTVAPDGQRTFSIHSAVGIDPTDLKNKPLLERIAKEQKQVTWAPDWTADVGAEGQVRPAPAPRDGGDVLWQAMMTIPLDAFPKGLGKVAARASWRINVILTDATCDSTGRTTLNNWALCPPTPAEPLGVPKNWPAAEFQPPAKK
ncbi:MAG TPA: PQQ-binding-like beta-propeller repeat protein [Tepidisphaeraceae bacterium]|nr:PQQ-binding-like beta-propeller repeat protein [Tepidisphaeraceae bacterium]